MNEMLFLIEILKVEDDPAVSEFRWPPGKESFNEGIYYAPGTIPILYVASFFQSLWDNVKTSNGWPIWGLHSSIFMASELGG